MSYIKIIINRDNYQSVNRHRGTGRCCRKLRNFRQKHFSEKKGSDESGDESSGSEKGGGRVTANRKFSRDRRKNQDAGLQYAIVHADPDGAGG